MNAIRLKIEHLFNPIGIDINRPRLFWNCQGGVTQTAYQIIAMDDGNTILWNSGRVESSSMRCTWGGEPVPARTAVTWKVRLWDENGQSGDWAGAKFETGLPKGQPWAAKWIAGDYVPRKKERYPVDCFRKSFNLSGVKKARLYITACGLYEARLNGARVGDFALAPGHTDYRKRVQYQTYDVTGVLREGENVLTVQLADGGAAGPGGCATSTALRPSCWPSWKLSGSMARPQPFAPTAHGSGQTTAPSALPTTRTARLWTPA